MGQDDKWSEAEELSAYRLMVLIRRFEEKAAQLYAMGDIVSLPQLSIGQEAIAAGIVLAARSTDRIIMSAPRPHGVLLARGLEPGLMMNALLAGSSLRNAATARLIDVFEPVSEHANSPDVAAALVQQAQRLRVSCGPGDAAVWFIGNGSSAYLSAILQAAGMASPIVFVIETLAASADELGNTSALFLKCAAKGVRTVHCNGFDVRTVKARAEEALNVARQTGCPTLLELTTQRYQGHAAPASAANPALRREDTDPIAKARARITLIGAGVGTGARLKEIESSARLTVSDALTAARGGVPLS